MLAYKDSDETWSGKLYEKGRFDCKKSSSTAFSKSSVESGLACDPAEISEETSRATLQDSVFYTLYPPCRSSRLAGFFVSRLGTLISTLLPSLFFVWRGFFVFRLCKVELDGDLSSRAFWEGSCGKDFFRLTVSSPSNSPPKVLLYYLIGSFVLHSFPGGGTLNSFEGCPFLLMVFYCNAALIGSSFLFKLTPF